MQEWMWDCDEVWTMNNIYRVIGKYITKLFIPHKQVIVNGVSHFDWKHINILSKKYGFEVITLHELEELPATMYPYEEIIKEFKTNYFCSSFDYMIAYALYKGFNKLRFKGVHFVDFITDETDSFPERCGVEFWIGLAIGRGVEISIEEGCSILQTRTGEPYAIDG